MPLSTFFLGSSGKEVDRLGQQLDASSSRSRQQRPTVATAVAEHSNEPSEAVGMKPPSELERSIDLKKRLQQETWELERLQEEHSKLTRLYQTALEHNRAFETWTMELTQDLEATRQLNSNLQQELQACKDDLFKLQPVTQTPDSDIAQSYDDLNEHISSWMEGVIARFEAQYRKRHDGPLPDLFHHQDIPAVAEFLVVYPTFGGEFLVRSYISLLLQRIVFADHILLLGLDPTGSAMLRSIEKSMATSETPRDPGSIKMWLSETLCALTTTAENDRSSRKVNADITNEVFGEVVKFFPVVEKEKEGLTTLWESVIRPAVTLARKIQISPTYYEFVPKVAVQPLFRYYDIKQSHLSDYKLVDVASRKTLKVNSSVQPDEKGWIGSQIMVLAPELCRRDPGKAPIRLVKEIDLIKLHKPLGRGRAATVRRETTNESSLI
ncbi:MAG: hypothetical protein Q9168_001911 [Polycauliona sp. 1 TL-2023]